MIVYVVYNKPDESQQIFDLNIPDINRLVKVLSCIEMDNIEIEFDKNKLKYKSNNINFKYHLLEDGIISTPNISFDKIKKLNFSTSFNLMSGSVSNLIKASTFTVDTDKVYIYTKDGSVYCELTDHQKHNMDSFSRVLADAFTGSELSTPIPLNFEIFRLMSSLRFESCSVNLDPEKKVLLFIITSGDYTLNFVTVGLVG